MKYSVVSNIFSTIARLFFGCSNNNQELNAVIVFSACLTMNLVTVAMIALAPFGLTYALDRIGPSPMIVLALSVYCLTSIALWLRKRTLLGNTDLSCPLSYGEYIATVLYFVGTLLLAAIAGGIVASFRS